MALTAQDKLHLKKLIRELQSHKAPHTEFVSVYIPKDYELTKIINHLAEEQGTAANIKSAITRKNVQNALEKMIQHLRTMGRTPPNGLAVFSGNVAAAEGKQDLRAWSIEPPVPLNIRIYRCDKQFVTDILEDMMAEHRVYGLVVFDRRDAIFALLKGKTVIPLQKTHSEVPGKFKAGGQCLLPNTLVRIGKIKKKQLGDLRVGDKVLWYDFYCDELGKSVVTDTWRVKKDLLYEIKTKSSSINASADHAFFVDGISWKESKGKGSRKEPVKTAEKLKKGDILYHLDETLNLKKEEIIAITTKKGKFELVDITVSGGHFFANNIIVHNSAHRFAQIREESNKQHAKKVADYMKEQFLPLGTNLKGIIIGGPGITINDFMNYDYVTGELKKKILGTKDLSYTGEEGLQELLDKAQDLLAAEEIAEEKSIMNRFFQQMRENMRKVTYGEKATLKALDMNAVDILLLSESLPEDRIFELEDLAKKGGATVKVISVETREGVQLKDLGGVAAILRYEVAED